MQKYKIVNYTIRNNSTEPKISERWEDSIAFTVKLWLLSWCTNPYMCEIVTKNKNDLKEILEWINTHERDFYLMGINTTNESQRRIFETSVVKLREEVEESLINFNEKIRQIDDGYTISPFTLG